MLKASLEERLPILEGFERKILDLGKQIFEPNAVHLFPLDLLATAVMDRALSLIFGFTSQIRANNFTCAAPLVRMHLDNVLRFYAACISEDPQDFIKKVLNGEHIGKLKDREGKKMSDTYLVQKMSVEHPWMKKVYDETSGYVHLSSRHIFNSTRLKDGEPGVIAFSISKEDRWVTKEAKIEAVDCMIEISEILYEYLYGWNCTKRLPSFPTT